MAEVELKWRYPQAPYINMNVNKGANKLEVYTNENGKPVKLEV